MKKYILPYETMYSCLSSQFPAHYIIIVLYYINIDISSYFISSTKNYYYINY